MPLLKLLGVPRFVTEESVLDLPPRQVSLLASYLASKEDWCSRDELLHLFWPDADEKTARHNLSQRLYQAKGQPWITGLETERNRVRWLVDTDVKHFRDALGDGNWKAASGQYGGALLEGVTLATSSTFDDWLAQERESLQTAWREAVLNYAEGLKERGETRQAAQHLQAVLKQDGLAEDVLQAYMRVALASGHRDGALKAFDTFYKQLEQELGMTPLETTQELAEKLRSGLTPFKKTQAETPESIPTAPSRPLPSYPTPFIGRELERATLLYAESLRETHRLGDKLGLAQSLEGFVHITASQGRAARALLLASAAAQLRESLDLPPLPHEQSRLESQLAKARAALPEKAAHESFKKGAELDLGNVVAYALEADIKSENVNA